MVSDLGAIRYKLPFRDTDTAIVPSRSRRQSLDTHYTRDPGPPTLAANQSGAFSYLVA